MHNPAGIFTRTRSQFAEAVLFVEGKPVSFVDYPMFRAIYDGKYPNLLLMTCRQVGKSTTLANFQISESIAIPYFKNFFVAPTQEQTHKYSSGRVGKVMEFSPFVKKHFVGSEASKRVLSRMFANGSEINFSYAQEDADRCRGISTDRLCLDEVQDIVLGEVLPVIDACMANSKYHYTTLCGTPKTTENSIHKYWSSSTQTEWVIKCDACNTHNVIRTIDSIGIDGPICLKASCKAYLNPRHGKWYDLGDPKAEFKGFHISRPMMPLDVPAAWSTESDKEMAKERWRKTIWLNLYGKNPYSLPKFNNEVLGVSDAIGSRIVTLDMLREMCDGPPISPVPTPKNMAGITHVVAGVDWSGGGKTFKSRNVVWILGKIANSNRVRTLYFKIFPGGSSPVAEIKEIATILKAYGSHQLVACDRGEGNAPTDMLRHMLDWRKVVKIAYSGTAKYYARWDREMYGYSVNRTNSIDSLMWALQRGEFQFPKDPDGTIMDMAFKDILSEYEEVTKAGNKIWDRAPDVPDDSLHAINFARIAMQRLLGQLDLSSSLNDDKA